MMNDKLRTPNFELRNTLFAVIPEFLKYEKISGNSQSLSSFIKPSLI